MGRLAAPADRRTGINFLDLAGAHMLGQEAKRRRALGGSLSIFNLKPEPLRMLRQSGQLEVIGWGECLPPWRKLMRMLADSQRSSMEHAC